MNSRRVLPILLLLFVASGCAALIYEVVWFQLLQLVIGSSAISLAVLLGTFMGGLCLGSLALPRYIDARRHPLRVYAVLEAGIGIIGILVLVGMPLINGIYTAWAGSGLLGIAFRAVIAAICLLPPTMLMGATLPALARAVETSPSGVAWLGFFYAGNTIGAVLGSLLAGFYLLRVFDLTTATFVAVAINAAIGLLAMVLATRLPYQGIVQAKAKAEPRPGAMPVQVAIALSGMTALAAEVIWTRHLSLLFGGTTYTFSLILAGFLLGLGIGSSLGSLIGRASANPRVVLGWCQALLAVAIAWASYMLADSLPYWPVEPSISQSPWFNFQLDFARTLWTVLPGAILWGATFPLALASVATKDDDPARVVGTLYGANTIGAIVGSLGAGLLVVAWLGTQRAQDFLVMVSVISGLLVLAPLSWKAATAQAKRSFAISLAIIIIGGGALVGGVVRGVPGLLIAYGRYAATRVGQAEFIYVGEGINASVAVSRLANGTLNYHNAGKVQASSEPQDMRLQRMLGHLTTLVPANPKSVLVIGCGAGVTAGAVSIDPRVEKLTIVEIEPLVPKTVSTFFSAHNFDVVRNPKTVVHIDDARHYVQTSREKFDAITSDPLDPWVKGAAMLYSKEFFETAKQHLNPGGVITLFVQLYWSNEEAVKSQLATFFQVFPSGIVWGNTYDGGGYDLVLLGQATPAPINIDEMEIRLRQPEFAPIAQSLASIGFRSAIELLATYAGRAQDLAPWLADAAINRDRNLRLQFLAGMGVNASQSQSIYSAMLAYRKPPESVFAGSDGAKSYLWESIVNSRNP